MKNLIWIAAVSLTLVACKSEIDNKPEAVVEEPTQVVEEAAKAAEEEKAVEAAETTTVKLAGDSTIEWVGAKVTGDHKGGFKTFTGTGEIDNDGKLQTFKVEVETASVFSDAEKLTGHLQSEDFFDVAAHPKSSFEATKIVENQTEEGSHSVTGNMNLRGVTKTITVPAKIETHETGVKATSEFTLKRFDFGIAYKGKADDLIKEDVLMKLTLNFEK